MKKKNKPVELTEEQKSRLKFVINYDQFVRIHNLDKNLAHEIQIMTNMRVVDDSLEAVQHLENIARQLQEEGTKDFELPFSQYGGKFVWVQDENK